MAILASRRQTSTAYAKHSKLSNNESAANLAPYEGAVDLLMQIRANAKQNKDWTTSDLIRDKLAELGFDVKDTTNGVEWSLK